ATVLLGIVLFAWTEGKPRELRYATIPVLVAVPFNFVQVYMVHVLQGLQKFDMANLAQMQVAALYAFGAVLYLVLDGESLIGLSIIYGAVYVQAGITSAILVFSQI